MFDHALMEVDMREVDTRDRVQIEYFLYIRFNAVPSLCLLINVYCYLRLSVLNLRR